MAAVGRNAPCPCGSGKKYKNCCAHKGETASVGSRIVFSLVAIVLIGGAIYFFTSLDDLGDGTGGRTRVWSAEHGHWH